ncbi:MAG: hypothetical protein ACRDPO_06060, partial [Streptosporangiaceae bacterium]
PRTWRDRPAWRWVAVAAGVLLLFYCAQREAHQYGVQSDGAAMMLQSWSMLHGNLLLRGWQVADVSFYTTELPEYMLVELVRGLNADTVHVAAALSYTCIVLLAGLLARGRATGREGAIRLLVAVGILLAPRDTSLLLGNPDHTGIHVPLLIIFLVLDRARPRWWVPLLVAVLLTWAQVADALVLYEGAIPLAGACLLRVNRRRGPLAGNWYDLSLAAGAAMSAAAAGLILRLIQHAGGFTVKPAAVSFLTVKDLSTSLYADLGRVLDVFGGKFLGASTGAATLVLVPGLVGFLLVAWGVAAGVRRLYRADTDLIVQVLTIAALIVLAAFLLGTKHDENEIIGLLPLGGVLAGRLLARPIIRDRLVPALALVLAFCVGMVAYNASRPADPAQNYQLTASWLEAHHLHYGLAGFWDASVVTVVSGDRIQVRPVRSFQARIVTTLSESSASWYDPHQHYANFVITRRHWTCPGVCVGGRALTMSFGPPAATYRVGPYAVLVWNKNLLARLRTLTWCNEGWPWNTPARPCWE